MPLVYGHVKNYRWDHKQMASKHRQLLAPVIGEPEGMICLDSSEFTKKGQESVGVARQYCGELGNWQARGDQL